MARLFGFIVLPAINALAPILVLPTITGRLGQPVWVTVAVAQSVGAAAAVVVELGWGLSGTQRVARQRESNRHHLIVLAAATRLLAFVPTAVVASVVVALLVSEDRGAAIVIVLAAAFSSLGVTWVFIGLGRPGGILLIDTLPRLVGLGIAAAAIEAGGSLWWYAATTLGATVTSVVFGHLVLGVRPAHTRRLRLWIVLRTTTAQSSALLGRAVSALYIALPVTLVSVVSSVETTAVFAAVERLQRMALTGLQAFPNAMQSWVGSATNPARRRRRAVMTMWINGGVGMAAGLIFIGVGPMASRFLFSGAADIGAGLAVLSAMLMVIVSMSRASGGIALVSVHRVDAVAWSAIGGAVVGVPALLMLGAVGGAPGALVAEILAEAVVLAVQLAALTRALRRARRAAEEG